MKPNKKPTVGKPTIGLMYGHRTGRQPAALALVSCAIVCLTLLLAAGSLQAGQAFWLGAAGATGTNWSNVASWSNSVPPNPGDDLIINDATSPNSLILNDDNHTIGLLQLGTNGLRTTAFTLVGTTNVALPAFTNTLTLTNGLLASNAASICLNIQTPLTLQGDQTWTVNSTTANIGTATAPRGVDIGNTGATNANTTNFVLTPNGTLTKAGLGMLAIDSPYRVGDGDINVQGGSLFLHTKHIYLPLVVGGTGSINVNTGARLMVLGAQTNGLGTNLCIITKPIVMQTNSTLVVGADTAASPLSIAVINSPVTWKGTNILAHYAAAGTTVIFNNNWSGNSVITLSNGVAGNYIFGLAGDNSGFSGKVIHRGKQGGATPAPDTLSFQNINAGSPNAEWSLINSNAYFEVTGAAVTNIQLGALSGTAGLIRANVGVGNATSLTIGALNTSTTCGAKITNFNKGTLALIKVGAGTLTLTATNSYPGGTVISNGVLASLCVGASGVGTGPVSIMNGATFSGTGLSTSCDVTNYAGGTLDTPGGTALSLNSLTCGVNATDVTTTTINVAAGGLINPANSLIVNGTNIINITGVATNVGTYNLISYPGSIGGNGFSGFQLGSLPPGMTASLQDSGSAIQLNVTGYVNIAPTNLICSISGGLLNLSWPADHLGWHLQCQTNSLGTGLGTNWVTIPGSDAVTSTNFPANPTNGSVFYRMVFP